MKKLALVLASATVVAGFAATYLWMELRAGRDELASLRATVTQMEKEQAEAAQAAAARAAQTAQLATAVQSPGNTVAVPPSAPGSATSTDPAKRLREGLVQGISNVLSSQAGNDLIRNQLRTTIKQMYPDMAEAMRFTPPEAEKFMDLLIGQMSDMTGDALGMLGGGSGPGAQEAQRKLIEKQLASEREISRHLGSKYPAWQDYQGTVQARQFVSQLRSQLATGPDALSQAQYDSLVAAMGAEQTRMNKADQQKLAATARSSQNVNLLGDSLKDLTAHNDQLLSTASRHLTDNQLEKLKPILRQQEAMLRAVATAMGGAQK